METKSLEEEAKSLEVEAAVLLESTRNRLPTTFDRLATIQNETQDWMIKFDRIDSLFRLPDDNDKRMRLLTDYVNVSRLKNSVTASKESLMNGTYFSHMDEIWEVQEKCFMLDINRFPSLVRILAIPAMPEYELTLTGAMEQTTRAAGDATASTTSRSTISNRNAYFSVDIFGGANLGRKELAHLMPASRMNANTWFGVVPWVLQMNGQLEKRSTDTAVLENEWGLLQKCIHGIIRSDKKAREAGLGIKHFRSNQIWLENEAYYYDSIASIIIVPILTAAEVTRWNGEGYEAIVLAGHNPFEMSYTITDMKMQASSVYQKTSAYLGGTEDNFLATPDEIDKATSLLDLVLCNLAYTNTRHKYATILKEDDLKLHKDFMSAYKGPFAVENHVKVPSCTEKVHSGSAIVRKVVFRSVLDETTVSLNHPAPHPTLLLVKAAVNFSTRQGWSLVAGGESSDSDTDSIPSGSLEYEDRNYNDEQVRAPDFDKPPRKLDVPHEIAFVPISCTIPHLVLPEQASDTESDFWEML